MKRLLVVVPLLLLVHFSFGMQKEEMKHIKHTAQQVLDKLYNASGNYIFLKPKLEISNSKNKVAAYLSGSKKIIVEVAAFRICQALGKDSLDALAYIIGHELAHSFQSDIQTHQETTNFLSYSHHFNSTEREEKTADIQGIFTAYLAGYKTKDVVRKVIQKIYEVYDLLNTKMSKYPPYEERLNMAYEVDRRVEELIQLFEAGNYLSALNRYEYASACYRYIEQYYQGEEIYNNMGVNLLLHAMNFTDNNIDFYLYPLELEWDSRLKKPKSQNGAKDLKPDEMRYRTKLIKTAIKHFEKAQKLNFNCFNCDINLVCAYTLLGEYQQAISYYLNKDLNKRAKLLQLPNNKKQKAQLALAIAYANEVNDMEQVQARKIFNELIASKDSYVASIARYNLETLENRDCKDFINKFPECITPFKTNKPTDGVQINSFKGGNVKNLDGHDNIQFHYRKLPHSVLFRFSKDGKEAYNFQRVFESKPFNFQLNSTDAKTKTVSTSKGYFLICEKEHRIFLVTNEGRINEWGKYFLEQ